MSPTPKMRHLAPMEAGLMSPIADPLPAIFEEKIVPSKDNDSPFLQGKLGKDGQMNHRQISLKSEASG